MRRHAIFARERAAHMVDGKVMAAAPVTAAGSGVGTSGGAATHGGDHTRPDADALIARLAPDAQLSWRKGPAYFGTLGAFATGAVARAWQHACAEAVADVLRVAAGGARAREIWQETLYERYRTRAFSELAELIGRRCGIDVTVRELAELEAADGPWARPLGHRLDAAPARFAAALRYLEDAGAAEPELLLTLFIGAGADLIESEESHLAALALTCLRARAH